MASSKRHRFNPIGFTPWPVTLISSLVYLALFIPLIVIQHIVPPAPKSNPKGVDLTEAWQDLQHLTGGFHPYNSHRNDEVHEWLLKRIHEILASSEDEYGVEDVPKTFVFDDNQSNLTFSNSGVSKSATTGVYFEGTNIIVYIRGTEDDQEIWWEDPDRKPAAGNAGGVLVNAHYDSVSTGFGATDDGVGVVTTLQLIKYFTSPGHHPRKGLVLLFNNGEEDFLNGARVFSQHPMSKFAHTFLNLEGAGAGGRAVLFRSSDTEVTSFYQKAAHPFGSVFSGDAFKLGYLRSETDYVVFNGVLGLRGLDVAFMEPRSQYHTDQDDARHTNIDSLWHMLSASIGTTEGLVSYTGPAFDGESGDDGDMNSGAGTVGVWFDLFGSLFAVFRLDTLFIISVILLVAAPLVLLATTIILYKKDKMYLLSRYKSVEGTDEDVSLQGLRGLFRYPFILVVASALAVGLAFLLTKVNPFIVYSSRYSVLIMMSSGWIFLAWFVSRLADFARPSALQRTYSFTWLFGIMWVLLVVNTVYQKQHNIAAGYFIVFYFIGTFLAAWVSYLELFALPRKGKFACDQVRDSDRRDSDEISHLLSPSPDELTSSDHGHGPSEEEENEPTESTSLLRGQHRTTFANYTRTGREDEQSDSYEHDSVVHADVFGQEQQWSSKLPSWTWLLQFILLAPIVIILVGQLALFLIAAMYQVGADGGSVFIIYISIAVFSILLFIPLSPFIHRFTHHVPTFLLLVFAGTLIYNLIAFPFSSTNRLKLAFAQEVDLDTGKNQASLTGVFPYVTDAINSVPSAMGKNITCDSDPSFGGRHKCSWDGLAPHVIEGGSDMTNGNPNDWFSFNISRIHDSKRARFEVSGRNTRACKLVFNNPVTDYSVVGSVVDERMPHIGPSGIKEIRLWSRVWENTWTVNVKWSEEQDDLEGRVKCLWSDDNKPDVIPALDEIRLYAPVWVAITKLQDGLVEASRAFKI